MDISAEYWVVLPLWAVSIKLGVCDLIREVYYDFRGVSVHNRKRIFMAESMVFFNKKITLQQARYIQLAGWTCGFAIVSMGIVHSIFRI